MKNGLMVRQAHHEWSENTARPEQSENTARPEQSEIPAHPELVEGWARGIAGLLGILIEL